jgi:cytochrome P450
MGHLPWVDRVIRVYNPIVTARVNKPVLQFTVDMMREHEKASAQFTHPDLYTHFSRSAEKYPTIMDADRIADNARSAIGGGSDTTSIILREIVYQLLVDPARLGKFGYSSQCI